MHELNIQKKTPYTSAADTLELIQKSETWPSGGNYVFPQL